MLRAFGAFLMKRWFWRPSRKHTQRVLSSPVTVCRVMRRRHWGRTGVEYWLILVLSLEIIVPGCCEHGRFLHAPDSQSIETSQPRTRDVSCTHQQLSQSSLLCLTAVWRYGLSSCRSSITRCLFAISMSVLTASMIHPMRKQYLRSIVQLCWHNAE